MRIAVDLDGMLFAFPHFFQEFFNSFQKMGNAVGIITGRPQSDKEQLLKRLALLDIVPDYFVGMPDGINLTIGVFKGMVCNDLDIDIIYDDFMSSDPRMLADFFSVNAKTIPFSSWAYDPDQT